MTLASSFSSMGVRDLWLYFSTCGNHLTSMITMMTCNFSPPFCPRRIATKRVKLEGRIKFPSQSSTLLGLSFYWNVNEARLSLSRLLVPACLYFEKSLKFLCWFHHLRNSLIFTSLDSIEGAETPRVCHQDLWVQGELTSTCSRKTSDLSPKGKLRGMSRDSEALKGGALGEGQPSSELQVEWVLGIPQRNLEIWLRWE